jgi:hypothetical protein
MTARRSAASEVRVVVHLVPPATADAAVRGEIESPDGKRRFTGWLDLMGQLEALVEESQVAAGTRPKAPRSDPK